MEDNNLIRSNSFTSEDLNLINPNSVKSSYLPPNVNVEPCKIEFFYEKFNQVRCVFIFNIKAFVLTRIKHFLNFRVLSNVQKPTRRVHHREYLSNSRHAATTMVRPRHRRSQAALRTTSIQCPRVHRFHSRFD
jgi:hypothetical protein